MVAQTLLTFVATILVLSAAECLSTDNNDFVVAPSSEDEGKRRQTGFTSGVHHVETLAWAVEIKSGDSVPEIPASGVHENYAAIVAKDCQLLNRGVVADLDNWYLLIHNFHESTLDIVGNALDVLPELDHVPRLRHNITTLMSFQNNNHSSAANATLRSLQLELSAAFKSTELDSAVTEITNCLNAHRLVQSHAQEVIRPRRKRSVHVQFRDPKFNQQWHLVNSRAREFDINVTGVWDRNITGLGVTVAVVDDGLEWQNPDLIDNYNAQGSYDLNDKDDDPSPNGEKQKNHHGTRCAGEIAAAANSFCGVGVAYRAGISGLRTLDGPMTDSLEATAFTKHMGINDIYSCSWGPDDDGRTVDGPHYLAVQGLRRGITYGRRGYGAIYVVASGNGGRHNDNCNYDGYSNSIYTLTIGAVDDVGMMPYYAEECASMLAVTFSSGTYPHRTIVTTDWDIEGSEGCTDKHSGTSAAAPLAAGMVALMLEARPCLTWRDVQYILVITAVKVDAQVAHYYRNKAGLSHSHKHGFGLMNAWRLVNTAKIWPSIPFLASYSSLELKENKPIPPGGARLEISHEVTEEMLDGYGVKTLEYVQVTVSLRHQRRGDVEILLRCPSQTESVLGAARKEDNGTDGFHEWTFSTVRCWGEAPIGRWTLIIVDTGYKSVSRGTLLKWQLTLYGSLLSPQDVEERRKLVEKAVSGAYLDGNFSLPCQPAPLYRKPVTPIPERWLKILALSGGFFIFCALYETFEYAFCYDKEKKEHKEEMRLAAEAARRANQSSDNGEASNGALSEEASLLLNSEDIHLDDLDGGVGHSSETTRLGDTLELLYGTDDTAVCDIAQSLPISCATSSNEAFMKTELNGQIYPEEEETSFVVQDFPAENPQTLSSFKNNKRKTHPSNSTKPDVILSHSSLDPSSRGQGQGHHDWGQGHDLDDHDNFVSVGDFKDSDPLLPR